MKIKRLLPGLAFAAMSAVFTGASHADASFGNFELGGGVSLDVQKISKGQFIMGSPETEAGRNADETPRSVTLNRDFYLGTQTVTVAQWERFATVTGYKTEAETGTSGGFGWNGSALEQRREFTWRNPGYPQSPSHPVVMVTWNDAREFLKWLSSSNSGWTFDLPSEAQWEYACRAGSKTAWWTGDEARTAGLKIWSKESASNQAHPADDLHRNPWSLNISGNVWEWCADWYGPYNLLSTTTDPLQNVAPASDKPRRVLRGGSWLRPLKDTRSAARYRNDARSRNADNSFRVMSFGPSAATAPAGKSAAPVSTAPPAAAELEPPDRRVTLPLNAPAAGENPPFSSYQTPPPPVSGSSGKKGFPGWVFLLLILGLLVWLIRRLFAYASTPPQPLPRSGMLPPPPRPLTEPLNLQPGAYLARPVQDGFWLNAGFAAGTWLNVTWRDENGLPRERRVQYAPGDDGHFIYTGSTPEQMQVSAGDFETVPPLPMPVILPPAEGLTDNGRNPASARGDRRHRPSAY